MNQEEKVEFFKFELSLINDNKIRKFTEKALGLLPDYFFVIPASTGGKYHPKFAAGEGGLVRHTQAAVRLAYELFRLNMLSYFSETEKDIIISSLILHDGNKAGDLGLHTVPEHPILMSDFLKNNEELKDIISEDLLLLICENIAHHMGQWTKDYKTGKEILEQPKGKMQNFVHLIDYIVSRRVIEFNLEAELSK
jgi:hypothetical protein